MEILIQAIIITLFVYVEQRIISTMTIGSNPPIIGGIFVGLIMGNVELGLYIGTVLTLMSLGMYTFGGAAIPNYFLGSVLGTAVAITMLNANPSMATNEAINVAISTIAIPASMVGIVLGQICTMACTAIVQIMAKYAKEGNSKKYNLWFWINTLGTNGIHVALPTFIGIMYSAQLASLINIIPQIFLDIFNLAGGLLPVMGFALLLSMMNLKAYWPFLLVGYFVIAYTNTTIIGLSILSLGIIGIYYWANSKEKKCEDLDDEID
ncbi:MAG: PTS sugar transporter subunit IIC [Erysipelotrichaceae bacterium]|nr:PTS sugar transporter subunit IIC [Erysipelotrichaceae bacterium]MDY5252553.1 PTS sugar transporter subunit IIC [Erysipelotrichaceae bacterium]